MKKMTIALLTAAAMGTSGFAVAQSGPDFGGRIDFRYTDISDDGSAGDLDNASSKFVVSGDGEGIAGISTFYYTRLGLDELDEDDRSAGVDYAYAGAEGAFGRLQAGIDDDLVYKYAGVFTDVFRGVAPTETAYYSDDFSFGDTDSLQYSIDVNNVSLAAYADTSSADGSDEPGDGDGLERAQLAASVDLGAATLSAVYSDRDSADDEQLVFGAHVDAGIATIGGHVSDDEAGNNPYAVAAVVPLNDVFTATVGYGDDDVDNSDVTGMIMANLGGGLDVNASYRNGDSDDGFVIGTRYSF